MTCIVIVLPPAGDLPGFDVAGCGTRYRDRIHAWVVCEPSVLELDEGCLEFLRDGVRWREPPLSVTCDPGSQKLPVPVCDDGGIRCAFE